MSSAEAYVNYVVMVVVTCVPVKQVIYVSKVLQTDAQTQIVLKLNFQKKTIVSDEKCQAQNVL